MLWVVAIATLALATQIAVVWAILHSSGGPLLMQEAMVTTERDGGRVLVFMERRLLSLSVGASSMIDAHPTWYEKEVLAREAMPTTYKALMHRLGVAANRPQSEWPDLAAWSGFPFPAMGFADNGGQWVGIGGDNPLHHIGIPTLVRWPAFVGNLATYAVVWWSVLLSQRWLVLVRRHRRGLCVRCAYDLAGLHCTRCPECGVPGSRPE